MGTTTHLVDFLVNLDRGTLQMVQTGGGFMQSVGLRWFAYLGAMMVVSCGVTAAWRHYDWGETAERFRSLVVGMAITYSLLQFYATPLPMTGLTFPQTINETGLTYANVITGHTAEQLMGTLEADYASQGAAAGNLGIQGWFDYGTVTLILLAAELLAFGVMVFGHVGQGVALVLGPLFIPWMMVPKLSKVFWGWLSMFLTFAIYPMVAASVMFMIGNAFTATLVYNGSSGLITQVLGLPVTLVLCGALAYAILKIPALAHGLMNGVAHSDFGEFVTGFVARAFL